MSSHHVAKGFGVIACVGVLLVAGFILMADVQRSYDAAQVSALNPAQEIVNQVPSTTAIIPVISTSTVTVLPVADMSVSSTATILFAGDIMLDRNVKARSIAAGSRFYPFQKLPSGWFDEVDYAVANLEGPITPVSRPPLKSIDFQFDPAVISALKQTGIDAFSQANNHTLDQGSQGYADSTKYLRDAGFLVFGHQVDDGDISFATTTINGIHVAFMGWNITDNPMDRVQAALAITHARAQSDVVIAFMHWGNEYHDHASPEQIDTAHWLIDQGIDAVIGGHPHWVEGMAMYKSKPIVWSLGNFVFDQDFSPETKQGMTMKLTIDTQGVKEIDPIPVSIVLSQPRVLEGAEKQTQLDHLASISDAELGSMIKSGVVVIR